MFLAFDLYLSELFQLCKNSGDFSLHASDHPSFLQDCTSFRLFLLRSNFGLTITTTTTYFLLLRRGWKMKQKKKTDPLSQADLPIFPRSPTCQPPFFIGSNHHILSRGLSSSKRNHPYLKMVTGLQDLRTILIFRYLQPI